jgi:hypothetical protein
VPNPPAVRVRLIRRQLGPDATEKPHRTPLRRKQPAGKVGKRAFVLVIPGLDQHQIARVQGDVDGDAGPMVVRQRQPDVVELQHGSRAAVAQSTLTRPVTRPLTRNTASTDRMKPTGIKARSAPASGRCSRAVRQQTTPIARPMPSVLTGSMA